MKKISKYKLNCAFYAKISHSHTHFPCAIQKCVYIKCHKPTCRISLRYFSLGFMRYSMLMPRLAGTINFMRFCLRACVRSIFCLFWIYTVTDLDCGHFSCLFFSSRVYVISALLRHRGRLETGIWPAWKHLRPCICGRQDFNAKVLPCQNIDSAEHTQHPYAHLNIRYGWNVEWP